MTKYPNRDKQTAILRRTQQKRKQEKREQVFQAIQELQATAKPLTFPNIAKVAGCSVSYLYKWPEITTYIHDLQHKGNQTLGKIEEEHDPGPHSLKTLHQVAKQRIQSLEDENKKLKHQNQQLRGHVAEIFELREECQKLRNQLQELAHSQVSDTNVSHTQNNHKTAVGQNIAIPQDIVEAIKALGISVGNRLQQEISKHSPETVKVAIEAFQQYRSQTTVERPGACLLTMIRDEAEPNIPQKPRRGEQDEFDDWYCEAIAIGFCLDIPQNYLPTQSGQIMVKVVTSKQPGYELIPWKDAQTLMKKPIS